MSARAWRGRRTGQWSAPLKEAKRQAKRERAACPAGCLLDCPYCKRHVVDVYSHLLYTPCTAAAQAGT